MIRPTSSYLTTIMSPHAPSTTPAPISSSLSPVKVPSNSHLLETGDPPRRRERKMDIVQDESPSLLLLVLLVSHLFLVISSLLLVKKIVHHHHPVSSPLFLFSCLSSFQEVKEHGGKTNFFPRWKTRKLLILVKRHLLLKNCRDGLLFWNFSWHSSSSRRKKM